MIKIKRICSIETIPQTVPAQTTNDPYLHTSGPKPTLRGGGMGFGPTQLRQSAGEFVYHDHDPWSFDRDVAEEAPFDLYRSYQTPFDPQHSRWHRPSLFLQKMADVAGAGLHICKSICAICGECADKSVEESDDRSDMEVILGGLAALNDEIAWFNQEAAKWGVQLSDIVPHKTNEEYCRFLESLMILKWQSLPIGP